MNAYKQTRNNTFCTHDEISSSLLFSLLFMSMEAVNRIKRNDISRPKGSRRRHEQFSSETGFMSNTLFLNIHVSIHEVAPHNRAVINLLMLVLESSPFSSCSKSKPHDKHLITFEYRIDVVFIIKSLLLLTFDCNACIYSSSYDSNLSIPSHPNGFD